MVILKHILLVVSPELFGVVFYHENYFIQNLKLRISYKYLIMHIQIPIIVMKIKTK